MAGGPDGGDDREPLPVTVTGGGFRRRAAGRIPSAFFGWDLGRNDHTDEVGREAPRGAYCIVILRDNSLCCALSENCPNCSCGHPDHTHGCDERQQDGRPGTSYRGNRTDPLGRSPAESIGQRRLVPGHRAQRCRGTPGAGRVGTSRRRPHLDSYGRLGGKDSDRSGHHRHRSVPPPAHPGRWHRLGDRDAGDQRRRTRDERGDRHGGSTTSERQGHVFPFSVEAHGSRRDPAGPRVAGPHPDLTWRNDVPTGG